ncbi:MAG: hypothetical protein JF603_15740, partial [Acidobacteria bacterium]|nr:hypothetical protein [Acidobacteriota bacterium]
MSDMDEFGRVAELASLQHGVVGRGQLGFLPWRDKTLRRWADSGLIDLPTPRVVRMRGGAPTALQRVMIAVLDAGHVAAASHWTAAWVWRLPGFDLDRLDVTVLRADDTRVPTTARLHRPRLLLPHHVQHIEQIPVTSLARTVFDLAGQRLMTFGRLERLVDTVLSRSPAMGFVLHRTLGELATKGRPGISVMRALLRDRPPGVEVPASNLERRFEEILRQAGELPLARQVNAGGEEWIGRIDFCDRSL